MRNLGRDEWTGETVRDRGEGTVSGEHGVLGERWVGALRARKGGGNGENGGEECKDAGASAVRSCARRTKRTDEAAGPGEGRRGRGMRRQGPTRGREEEGWANGSAFHGDADGPGG